MVALFTILYAISTAVENLILICHMPSDFVSFHKNFLRMYLTKIVYPQEVSLYQVGDLVEGASFYIFLDALDASYCSYEKVTTQMRKSKDPFWHFSVQYSPQ
jgi:hypothetical protein